ncbi:MAG: ABC transporter permease [Simkaniaceae bacterium]|nr:ABC transporter permease [Simkaniaceae bacterium]
MVFFSALFSLLIGLPVGVILTVTDKGHIREHVVIHKVLGAFVNVGRSFPFAILMVALIPVTRWIVGTSLGTTATIVPLTVAAAPFFARLVESSLKGVDEAVLEMARVTGSSARQMIMKVLIPEALPMLCSGLTTTVVNLVGYSAMAGLIGGGGLGEVAIRYGYNRFNTFVMIVTIALLIVIVWFIEWVGRISYRRIVVGRGMAYV